MKFTRTVCVAAILAASAYGLLTGAMPNVQSGQWAPAGEMSAPRDGAASVLLPGGRVLVTGGESAGAALATTEVLGTSGTFSAAASMATARARHAAVLLEDGRAVVIGGRSGADAVGSAEAYASGTWTAAGDLVDPRWGHTVTLLADGRVLVAGGENANGPLASVEIFDPATGQFTFAGTMTAARVGHAAARLHDGRVLLAGGFTGGDVVASIDVFDAETGVLAPLPTALLAPRTGLTATTLLDGRVLFFGGYDGGQDVATGELFDPATGGVTPSASATTARRDHQAFLLPNNNAVLVVGGASGTEPMESAELYLPSLDQFRATGSMSVPRASATGSRLSEETYALFPTTGVLPVMGGSPLASSELYGFATIRVDKDDYLPGDTVYFSAAGWQPNETLTVTLRELPEEHGTRTFTVKADGSGRVVNLALFQVEDHHLGVHFELTARGAASLAMTRFTDGNLQSVSLTPASRTVTAGSSAEYTVLVGVGGNSNLCTVTLAVTAGLPTGASASFNGNVVDESEDFSRTLTIATTASTPTGSYPFTVTAFRGSNCQGNGNLAQTGTLVVTAGTVATETVASAASATYGDASVTLSAAVSRVGDSDLVSGGTVAFTLTSGSTVVGGTTSGAVVDGTASVSYALPAGLSAGDYTVEAEYGGSTGLDASSGTSSLVIGKATAAISVTGKTVTYDGNAHGASGTATGVSGIDLSGSLNLGSSFTDAPGGTADWTFTGGTNYNDASGSVAIVIERAASTTTVVCADGPFTYTGAAQTPCSASVTGAGGLNESVTVTYSDHVNAGTATASASYAESANHLASSNSMTFTIGKKALTVTADDQQQNYGLPLAPFTVQYAGLVGGEAPSVLQGALAFTFAGIAPTTYAPSPTAPVNAGTYRITPSGLTSGNYTITFVPGTLTISSWWTLNGFTQPVGIQNSVMNNTVPDAATVWNVVKGGSTVPLKFNVFADTVEKTSLSDIMGFTQQPIACAGSSVPVESVAEELLTTGNTSLSYTGGQFHQNWKTSKVNADTCYRATVTTKDGSTLSAFFVLRK